ncbi:hypothetical protein OCB16_28555, partial [Bacillus cereus]|nr:hypothetical protein [Bacillus cereus]
MLCFSNNNSTNRSDGFNASSLSSIKSIFFISLRKCHGHHFLSLCVWLNQQIATTSLTQLCSQLETSTGILLSPE